MKKRKVIATFEFKEFPKSSIIRPELEEQNKDVIPPIMVNNTNLIHCDQDTKEQTEAFLEFSSALTLSYSNLILGRCPFAILSSSATSLSPILASRRMRIQVIYDQQYNNFIY